MVYNQAIDAGRERHSPEENCIENAEDTTEVLRRVISSGQVPDEIRLRAEGETDGNRTDHQ